MPAIDDSKYLVTAGWDDVPHLSEAAKAKMLKATPPHLRQARSKGEPSMGAGAIYPISAEDITVPPFMIPPHWPRGFSLDDGWNRTAALWFAYDRESDTLYVTSEHYSAQQEPQMHAQAILARGAWIPGVGDAAARTRDGVQILTIYQSFGLKLILADKEVEAGIYDVYMRLSTGRLKVFSTCRNFFAEYRKYRRDDKGRIVKVDDHLMDCLRYGSRPAAIMRMIAKPAENIIGSARHVGDRRIGY